ncbi:MAG: alpha-1,4-glucan--maltose-1-phosphate maltosyltransferase, partial [Burkholderiaceae bacterium]
TPEQIDALAGCGFDAAFSSAAWWDDRAGWLAEEWARLAAVAPPIAFPDDADGSALHRFTDPQDDAAVRGARLRALRLAAGVGCGLLVPSDFLEDDDLRDAAAEACATVASIARLLPATRMTLLEMVTMDGDVAAAVLRHSAGSRAADEGILVLANPSLERPATFDTGRHGERLRGLTMLERLLPAEEGSEGSGAGGTMDDATIRLAPGEVQLFRARRAKPVTLPANRGRRAIDAATKLPRIAIEAVSPAVDGGAFPVKRVVGECVDVEADVFADGHDRLGVALRWRAVDEAAWQEVRMHPLGNDRWRGMLPLARMGRHVFVVEGWRDAFATYRDELDKKVKAGLNVTLELEEGRRLVQSALAHAVSQEMADVAAVLRPIADAPSLIRRGKAVPDPDPAPRIAALLAESTAEAMRRADARPFAVQSEPVTLDAERIAARFSSWYELFPRSQSGDPQRHGTFADVEKRLPAIRDMGFDTLYFPPIHPIGRKNRKGRNNSLTPSETDPGSPYAIGSEEGGHDAIHPQLGTIEDFGHLRDTAAQYGLELALDFAIQCSPDHPWLKHHPEWFDWRPNGSLRYAENPPKKYEDIVNVDFYAEGAVPGLWIALRDAVLFWVKEGVRVFRVDNPHTKPLPFWQWMIGDIRMRYPDTIFLSEAFTRPKVMYRLAKVGFSQSYTYFTWRHTRSEFIDYLTELTTTSVRDFFRPHFFVNTPDINPVFLQKSGRPGFLIRAALATTLSGLWGMYSGFELCEGTPVPGKEEYLDSEKYEIRAWDWHRPGNIVQEIGALNRIRRANPALQTHLGVRFERASDDNILFFIKATPHPTEPERFGDNVVLVAINLDPFAAHETDYDLPLWRFGLPDDATLDVEDLVHGNRFALHGKHQRLRLDPFELPYAIWRLQPGGGRA